MSYFNHIKYGISWIIIIIIEKVVGSRLSREREGRVLFPGLPSSLLHIIRRRRRKEGKRRDEGALQAQAEDGGGTRPPHPRTPHLSRPQPLPPRLQARRQGLHLLLLLLFFYPPFHLSIPKHFLIIIIIYSNLIQFNSI